MTDLNKPGVAYANSLIAAGKVDRTSSWSFSADDGNALLGDGGDDWASYGKAHLGIDTTAAEQTKARYSYPFAKGGKLYRSGLIAIRQRAGQQGEDALFAAAGTLLDKVDADKAVSASRTVKGLDKGFDAEVKEISERTLAFTISTETVDRMGDSVSAAGWKLDQYKRNPVVLWAHDSSALPVGKASNIKVKDGALKANVEFTPQGQVPLNDTILSLYKGGFLSATSVGFLPLKYTFSSDATRGGGMDFLEQELLEFSLVPIPANPDALMQGKRVGIDVAPYVKWIAAHIGDEEIIRLAADVAGRRDLFARELVERVAGAAAIPILTPERQRRLAELETKERLHKQQSRRKRDMDLIRLRGA